MKSLPPIRQTRWFAGNLFILLILTSFTNCFAQQNTWTQKANFGGLSRYNAVGFSIGDKGYIGLGVHGQQTVKNDFWEYDPVTNVWTQKADYKGIVRYDAVSFSIGKKGYVGTGTDDWMGRNEFWEYNPSTNAWTQKANFGGRGRRRAVGFSIGDKGYIGLGDYTSDFWQYDPATDKWTRMLDFPDGGRSNATGFSAGGKGYVGMGRDEYQFEHDDLWEFDPYSNSWKKRARFPDGDREEALAFSIGEKGYVGLGGNKYEYHKKDFWEYDPVSNFWKRKADFAGTGKISAVGFSINGRGYIGTGDDSTYSSTRDFWEYTPDTINMIATYDVDRPYFCPESILKVPFTSNAVFDSGNIFTVQLSDKDGNFISPDTIGTIASTLDSGKVTASFPSYPIEGTKYRIRITSSQPKIIGSNNGVNLRVGGCDSVTELVATGISPTAVTIRWKNVHCSWQFKIEYKKQSDTAWSVYYIGYDSCIIRNLQPDTIYQYRIQKICTESGSSVSPFTSIRTFTTNNLGNRWKQKANFYGAVKGAVGFSIDSMGYIGTGENDYFRKDFWQYNPRTNVWKQVADFGGGNRADAVAFSIGHKGYAGTGFNWASYEYKKDFWEYDPSTNVWTRKADFAGEPTEFAAGFSIADKGYIGTGYDNGKSLWEYDPMTDTWTRKADFGGIGRWEATGFSIGNKGYIGLGSFLNDFWEYDPATDSWSRKADFPGGGREGAAGFSIGKYGYIGTGENYPPVTFKNDFWRYDPETDSWTLEAEFPGTPRWSATGFSIGNQGYIGTGGDKNGYNYKKDFWEYTPDCIAQFFYADADGDGYGNAEKSVYACEASAGYVTDSGDCDDTDKDVHPGAKEILNNGIDDNCNGLIDELKIESRKEWSMLSVYPNPAIDKIIVLFPFAENTITISDILGREIKQMQVHDGSKVTIAIADLPYGSYIISLKDQKGNLIVKEKLFKQ